MPEGVPKVEINKLGSEACSAVCGVMAAMAWSGSIVVLDGNIDGTIIDSIGCCWLTFSN
jgi:hypothetical protein